MKKIVAFACLPLVAVMLFATQPAASPDWVEYLRDGDGNVLSYHSKVNIDKKDGKLIVQVLGKEDISDQGREKYLQSMKQKGLSIEGYEHLSKKTFLCDIDCAKKTIRTSSYIVHDTEGKVIFSGENKQPVWEPVRPDSTGDVLRKAVCK
jgi:hypothetical protein